MEEKAYNRKSKTEKISIDTDSFKNIWNQQIIQQEQRKKKKIQICIRNENKTDNHKWSKDLKAI